MQENDELEKKKPDEVLTDEEITAKVREVLYRNMVSGHKGGFKYHFTKPSPGTYPFQFFWDTCFHVFTLTALGEVDMAKKHLYSLFAMQQPDGFVGHMSYWDRLWPGRVTDLFQLKPQDALHLFKPHMSALVQPPLVAQAVLRVYQGSQDLAFVREMYPKLKKYYRWLAQNRDFEGEGLLSIITPFESGMDWKASYDPVVNFGKGKAGPLLFLKMLKVDAHNFRKKYDLKSIYQSNQFIVKDVSFNTIYAQNLEAMAQLCQLLGESDAAEFTAQAQKTEASILKYMYHPKDQAFYDLQGHHFQQLKVKTATILFPVVLDSIPDEITQEVLQKHLFQHNGFHVPYPIPSLATDEPAFNPNESLFIWRGPTWVVFNWFMQGFLLQRDYVKEARHLLLTVKRLITKGGCREYYDPFTGEGHGAHNFTWAGLVVDMMQRQQAKEREDCHKSDT